MSFQIQEHTRTRSLIVYFTGSGMFSVQDPNIRCQKIQLAS